MSLRSMTMVWALLAASSASASTDLDWLQGDWCGERKGVQNEEHWGSAKAGVMLGWHRDTRDGKLVGFEFMRITFDAEGIRFHAQPGGKPETIFPATTSRNASPIAARPTAACSRASTTAATTAPPWNGPGRVARPTGIDQRQSSGRSLSDTVVAEAESIVPRAVMPAGGAARPQRNQSW